MISTDKAPERVLFYLTNKSGIICHHNIVLSAKASQVPEGVLVIRGVHTLPTWWKGIKEAEMEKRKVSVTDLIPYENNPRNNDGAVDAVAESIKQCGYIAPIIVDEDMVILAGHTRYRAITEVLEWDEVEVIVETGLTEEQKKKYRILDNKTNEFAQWDFELLKKEAEGLDFDFDFGIDGLMDKAENLAKQKEKEMKPMTKVCTCPRCGKEFEE